MIAPGPRFYFDFIDPLSFLLERELTTSSAGDRVVRVPFEIRPPPAPLVGLDDVSLRDRWSQARVLAEDVGVAFAPPRLVPWSRKAHELHLLAATHERASPVRLAIFEAHLVEGRDIGRVDVLVEIARGAGLDPTETKAVLDVDRHDADVTRLRAEAGEAGVTVTPTIVWEGARLEGFHNRSALGTFLRDLPADG